MISSLDWVRGAQEHRSCRLPSPVSLLLGVLLSQSPGLDQSCGDSPTEMLTSPKLMASFQSAAALQTPYSEFRGRSSHRP